MIVMKTLTALIGAVSETNLWPFFGLGLILLIWLWLLDKHDANRGKIVAALFLVFVLMIGNIVLNYIFPEVSTSEFDSPQTEEFTQ